MGILKLSKAFCVPAANGGSSLCSSLWALLWELLDLLGMRSRIFGDFLRNLRVPAAVRQG